MSPVLGKRKARPSAPEPAAESDNAAEIFRRHFEAQFKPLPVAPALSKAAADAELDEDERVDSEGDSSEWDGISDEEDDDTNQVQVVDYTSSANSATLASMTKREMKAFMSSRPPLDPSAEPPKPNSKGKPDDDEGPDEDSAAFLANDLALQRLISESKILSDHAARSSSLAASAAAGGSSTKSGKGKGKGFADGRLRLLTTDMRLRALGGRESVLEQRKMPMSIRRGITGAAAEREAKRRKEAKENGVVLEREVASSSSSSGSKARRRGGGGAVDMPSIGKMRGAELRLSKRDIRSMEGGDRGGRGDLKKRKRRR